MKAQASIKLPVNGPKRRTKKQILALPKSSGTVTTQEMMGKSITLVVDFRVLGNERKIDTDKVKVDADPNWINVTKQLIESETLDEIRAVGYRTKTFIRRHSLPSLLKDGVYLLPSEFVGAVDARLQEDNAEIARLVQKLGAEYDDILAESKARLNGLFDSADYPSKQQLAAKCGIDWRYISFDVPVSLAQVNREVYAREQEKAEAAWKEAREVWKVLLRTEFSKLVDHMVERLTPAKDGKKKIFRDTALTNLMDWSETFNPRNIQNDAQLRALVEKAKALVNGTSPDTLREDEHAREMVRSSFQSIKNTLDKLVVLKPSRDVSFDD
jgi:hypothetical protein